MAVDGMACEVKPPVLVFGALRSGTTVFRLMLNAHPLLNNPGEVDFLFDCLRRDPGRADGWRYDLKALSENRIFRASGLRIPPGRDGLDLLADFLTQYRERNPACLTLNIHRNIDRALEVLPGAPVIHVLRDPRDVARSCIGMGWAGTLFHGVQQWIFTETEWDEARARLADGQALELTYEALIADTPGCLGRICDFLGVDFDEAMLSYHKDTTYGAPDPALIAQWKRKSSPHEVALVEGRVAAMMRARGYEPAGAPHYPGMFEKAGLMLRNRAHTWRVAIGRYGFALFALEKLTRRLGLGRLHSRCRARMHQHDIAILK
ncbi:MAG: sulfotransferase family protein [Pseudomonadota bacterium]|uniref:sulfotransferase family protein n=1 Tax=Roseovarius sp. TaxID=1486281 RepID=UPI0035679538